MSFSTALSGLNAASNLLAVTGNNVANANTTGFKKSRSEFADAYSSLGGKSSVTPGSGVQVAKVAQQFSQGNLDYTDNNLDLAMSGDGFFVLGTSINDTNARFYTRAGNFHVNQDGYVVNNLDQPMLVYPPNGDTVSEGFSTGIFQPLRLDTAQSLPKATTAIDMSITLDSRSVTPTAEFNPADPTTYNWSNSSTVFDSLGNSHTVTSYFVKTADLDDTGNALWQLRTYLDGTAPENNMLGAAVEGTLGSTGSTSTADPDAAAVDPITVAFDSSGRIAYVNTPPDVGETANFEYQTNFFKIPNAEDLQFTFNLAGSTQVSTTPSTNSLTQDGLPIGNLTGVDIDKNGIVFARYSNGASIPMGEVAVARFQNPQGLTKRGDTQWAESVDSGSPINGVAGTSAFGTIKSGALESANVDLAQQLVTLIIAQQAYQANAQTISTENQLTQTILNLR
jgi:flagellar hook protein FlgE